MTSVASLEEEFFAGKSIAGGDPNFWKRSSHFPPAVLLPKKEFLINFTLKLTEYR